MAPIRILVVDDNHLIRKLIGLILEGAGYTPIDADSGEAALALALADPLDLVIVDEVMPGMLGSELVRLLRRSRERRLRNLAVVGISGHDGAARALLQAGADAFVAKPVEEHPLLDAVARALGRPFRPDDPPGLPAA